MKVESVAAICHEANRRYCQELGDDSQKSWEEAPWWQKQSALAGVLFVMRNPGAPPSAAHDEWVKNRAAEGWKYGESKSEEMKIHPSMVAHDKLPKTQQLKDSLFRSIVLAIL